MSRPDGWHASPLAQPCRNGSPSFPCPISTMSRDFFVCFVPQGAKNGTCDTRIDTSELSTIRGTSGLFGGLLSEGGIHVIFRDPRRGISDFIKILLFSAITHHSRVSDVRRRLFVALTKRFICHVKYSVRDCACLNRAGDAWFPGAPRGIALFCSSLINERWVTLLCTTRDLELDRRRP